MDPRDRADAVFNRAGARRHGVVTPINQSSPMDATSTSRIQRSVIDDAQRRVEDQDTQSIPGPHDSGEITQPVPATRPQPPHPEPEWPRETELDGLIPTVQQQRTQPSLADRLSGLD